jgi:chromosome segregation ATPase
LQSRFQSEGATQEVIAGFTQLDNQIKSTSERAKELQSSLKSAKDAATLEDRKSNLNNKIETWLRNNTRASESMRQSMKSLQTQIQSADKQTLTHLTQQFNELNRTAQQTGQIGKSALDIFKEKAAKFAGWFGLANAFMSITNEAKQALVTLKDVDSILTEISKTSERSAESLEKLGETAFDAASKYGVSVQNYLTGVQEMARAGYETMGEGQSEKMAELALLAQAAGDVTDSVARDYLIATDAAYQLGGSIEKLQTILDGQNKVNIKCPHIQKCMCA